MGIARETIVGYVTSLTGSTTFNALTNNPNQSFTVRSFPDGATAHLEDVWAAAAAHPYQFSIKSPRLHDDVKGILTTGTPLGAGSGSADFNPQAVIPGSIVQELYSTDVLSVTANGTASDKFIGVFNVRYSDLNGINARLATWDQVSGTGPNYVGILVQPTASGTVGLFGTGVAINSVDQRLKANTYYAWVGYQCSIPVAAVVMNGVDLGNLSVGGPGSWNIGDTGDFFIKQARAYNTPAIPVINSNNQGGTFVSIADIVASTAPNVTLIFKELGTSFGL